MQSKAEADSEQMGSDQGHPRREVPVMSVNVLYIERRQSLGQRRAHYRVAQRTNAAARGRPALPQQGSQQLPELATIGDESARRSHQLIVRERLEKACFLPESPLRQSKIIR